MNLFNYQFNDIFILKKSLTHKSFSYNNNEKLEFFGDSILFFLVTDKIYKIFFFVSEDKLSYIRTNFIKTNMHIYMCYKIDINKYVLINIIRYNLNRIIANIFESLIGSLYLDGNLNTINLFVKFLYFDEIFFIKNINFIKKDYKTLLKEYLQYNFIYKKFLFTLKKVLIKNNTILFYIYLRISFFGVDYYGIGFNKKQAEQDISFKILNFIKFFDVCYFEKI